MALVDIGYVLWFDGDGIIDCCEPDDVTLGWIVRSINLVWLLSCPSIPSAIGPCCASELLAVTITPSNVAVVIAAASTMDSLPFMRDGGANIELRIMQHL